MPVETQAVATVESRSASDAVDLDELVHEIKQEMAAAAAYHDQFVEHAVLAGQKLIKAKAEVGQGNWGAWLIENFPKSERTAQRYMQMAEKAAENPSSVTDLNATLTGTLGYAQASKKQKQALNKSLDKPADSKAESAASQSRKPKKGFLLNLTEEEHKDFVRQVGILMKAWNITGSTHVVRKAVEDAYERVNTG